MRNRELIELEDQFEGLRTEIIDKQLELIFDETGLQESEIAIGDWNCDKSPIGFCVYDIIEDPACDYCVFCHQPDERK